jgi:H+/Cl- antiporter ClcA
MDYDPYYPTTLPPLIALPIFFALNILVPLLAHFVGRSFKRYKWAPHILAFLWVLASVFMFDLVGSPHLASDEAEGPGDGLLFLPLALETAAVLVIYLLALAGLLVGRLIGQNAPPSQGNRY